jgi:membrane-bound lytic murein transglycosylase D
LRRRQQYIPAIESALKEQNLPLELGYLVWIESAYEIDALSSAGAKGLWQLMPATAREYGLRVDQGRRIDERVDPLKSSRAAASYLNLLLKMFGGQRYLLAIASYNTGQNRVQRFQIATTIRQSRAADFWHLVDQLPAETVDYVPKFLAAVIVARNPGRF